MTKTIVKKAYGELGTVDRVTRVVVGTGAIIALLHLAITTAVAYPFLSIIMSAVVLTGIAGWDPMYALFRYIVAQVSGLKVNTTKPLVSSLS